MPYRAGAVHGVLALVPLLLLPVFVHAVLTFAGETRMQIVATWGLPWLVWASLFAVFSFAARDRGKSLWRGTITALIGATLCLAVLDGIDLVETPW